MESGGDGGTEGGVVDASVGTIVWVRRRNGSWWPGRILGPGELAESHLLSPRSGTPVKLLGREDASVDWYNLEKSKRVKAFRCGEFDACIERAEAAQGVPIKKREKYARREDAILHALELERKNLQTTGEKPNSSSQSQPTKEALGGFVPKISKKPEVSHRYKSKKQVPEQEIDGLIDLKKPFENRAYGDSPVKKDRRRPLLKDLENSTDSPLSIPVPVPDPYDSYQPGMSHAFDTGAVLLRGTVPVQGSLMGGSPVYRARRTQCVYLPYQSEEDNAHVKIENMDLDFLQEPLPLEEDFDSYGMFDNNEPKSEIGPVQELDIRSERKSETETETESRASGSSEETDTDMEEPNELLIDTKQAVNQEPDVQSLPYRSAFHDSENYIRETEALPYNDICTGTASSFLQDDSQDETGVSKWNMKGKRNNRNGTNKKGNSTGTNQGFYQPKEEFDEEMHLPLSWDGYYENAPLESMLVDVDLTVQASYQGERVPLVSLMSRLNGKAIVGYPLQIEILEEGSSSMFLPCTSSGTDSCPDGSSGLPPVWRTGRRTVKQRIVRPNTSYRSMAADQIHHTKKKKKKKKKTKKATSKSHKKSTKWKTKTKAISSLGGGDNLGGFVKKDGVVPVLPVTCVPVKVAFSRILEAVGRPCSHRARMPSLTVRDPP